MSAQQEGHALWLSQVTLVEVADERGLLAVPVAELGEVGVEASEVGASLVEGAHVDEAFDGGNEATHTH